MKKVPGNWFSGYESGDTAEKAGEVKYWVQ